MAILYFSDVLRRAGIDPARVKLIRHSLSNRLFKACYDANKIYEYTCHQSPNFKKFHDYWIVFISATSSMAKLYACYKVGDSIPDVPEVASSGLPELEMREFRGESAYYNLTYDDALQEYENRLVIDWGASTRAWAQSGKNEKAIVSLQADAKKTFSGFETLLLTYDELKDIVENQTIYEAWHTALASVYAIYLITDTVSGRHYVGSAYGSDGLLGRWRTYVHTLHGNNKRMQKLLADQEKRYHSFQFSILQIILRELFEVGHEKARSAHSCCRALWKRDAGRIVPNFEIIRIARNRGMSAACYGESNSPPRHKMHD